MTTTLRDDPFGHPDSRRLRHRSDGTRSQGTADTTDHRVRRWVSVSQLAAPQAKAGF
jgi:hypothetical protein